MYPQRSHDQVAFENFGDLGIRFERVGTGTGFQAITLHDLAFARLNVTTRQSMELNPSDIGMDRMLLLVQRGKLTARHPQHPDLVTLSSGQGLFHASESPTPLIVQTTEAEFVILAYRADAHGLHTDGLLSTDPMASPMFAVFAEVMARLIRIYAETTPSERIVTEHFAVEVIRMCHRLMQHQSESRDDLYRQACSIVRDAGHDPALTVQGLADRMHVSSRHLQRAFALHGRQPKDEIRKHRSRLAHHLLCNTGLLHLTLGEIATLSGFQNTAQLRRALLGDYGVKPHVLRAATKTLLTSEC